MLRIATGEQIGGDRLYEAFRDRQGYGRISVREQLSHRTLGLARPQGEVWGTTAAVAILVDLGYLSAVDTVAEQMCAELIDPQPYAGWVLTEDTVRGWLARHAPAAGAA